jgi:hypothetical protein
MTSGINSSPKVGEQDIIVEGAVQERKFESILGNEIFISKEGHSDLRTAAVILATLPLLPLIALYDLVRYGLFQFGSCNGKSWSWIDKASQAVKSLATKVESATAIKELTNSDLDDQSQQMMKFHVGKILDGYRALQGGIFGKLFDSSSAIKGEKQIAQGKANLTRSISTYLKRNVETSARFIDHLNSVKDYVRALFVEEGKDDLYILNKVERNGPQPLLSEWANGEFEFFLQSNPIIAGAYLAQTEKDYALDAGRLEPGADLESGSGIEPGAALRAKPSLPGDDMPMLNYIFGLKRGVDQGFITGTQAKQKVQELARDSYTVAIAHLGGPKIAAQVLEDVLTAAGAAGLVSAEEANQMNANIQLTPKELATAVVQSIIEFKEQNPTTKAVVLDQKIATAARELKKQGKLSVDAEVEFVNTAKAQLDSVQADLEVRAQATIAAQNEADAVGKVLRANQAADSIEAIKQAAAVQRIAAEKQNLFDVLKLFLNGIAEKQKTLLGIHSLYDAQAAEKADVVSQIQQILSQKVYVGKDKKEMTVLQAYEYRSKKIADINSSRKTPDQQIAKLAQFDKDFGDEAVAVISRLHGLQEKLAEQTKVMSETLRAIGSLDVEIATDIVTYKKFAKPEKKKLDLEPRKEIEALEKGVFSTKTETDGKYRKANNLTPFARLPSEDVVAQDVNIEDFLNNLVKVAPKAETEEQPSMATRLWNGITAPFSYAAQAVGLS